MAIRNIRYDGDDILRKVCRPVEKMDDRTLTLIDDMFDTMYEANGSWTCRTSGWNTQEDSCY